MILGDRYAQALESRWTVSLSGYRDTQAMFYKETDELLAKNAFNALNPREDTQSIASSEEPILAKPLAESKEREKVQRKQELRRQLEEKGSETVLAEAGTLDQLRALRAKVIG